MPARARSSQTAPSNPCADINPPRALQTSILEPTQIVSTKMYKLLLSLFLPTEPFSLGILDGSAAYNFDQYKGKTFDGFIRHSNNPNYVRLANKDISQYRLITQGEWDRMDNTNFDNQQQVFNNQVSLFIKKSI